MTQDYLNILRQHLKDFSAEEQESLIEEISSHIESGEDDPKMGKNKDERRKKLMAELGSPQDIGHGFKEIYRNDRLIDYLFIAIPYLLYPFLNTFYVSLMSKYGWADVRLDILIHLPLVLIGLWRRSALITLFWTATLITQIISMLLITQGYYGMLQIAFWLILAVGLLILLGRILWQNLRDPLITAFGLLPLTMCLVGSVLAIIHPGAGASFIYGPIDRMLLNVYIGGGYLPFYGTLVTLAMFFLAMNRTIRWLALGLYGLVIALSRNYLNLFDADQGLMHPGVYLLYVIVPLILVFLGWWLGRSGGRAQIAK